MMTINPSFEQAIVAERKLFEPILQSDAYKGLQRTFDAVKPRIEADKQAFDALKQMGDGKHDLAAQRDRYEALHKEQNRK